MPEDVMKQLKYVAYREGEYYVAQCLNVDVSSFGDTIDEAIANLKEAVELYLEDETGKAGYHPVGDTLIGELAVNA
jgi:predicted RNase H-like HicB family nuclease